MRTGIDEAPISSDYARRMLIIHADVPERILMDMAVVTKVNSFSRAETMVARVISETLDQQAYWDAQLRKALRKFPGAEPNVSMTLGLWFTIEWDGVTRPV